MMVAASRCIMDKSSAVWGSCRLQDLGTWATGSGFPLEYQGVTGLPYMFSKVSDMNRPGNEIYLRSTANTIDQGSAKEIGAKIHPPGTVIFPKIGGAIATNKRRILAKQSAIDNNLLGIIPHKNVNSEWLYSFLRSIDLSKYQSGTSVPALRQSALAEMTAPRPPLREQIEIGKFQVWLETEIDRFLRGRTPSLPPPLQREQTGIALILYLMTKIEEAQVLQVQAENYSQSLFDSAVVSVFENLEAPHKALSTVTTKIGSGSTPRGGKSVYLASGVPLIRSQNIRMRSFRWLDMAFIDDRTHHAMSGTHVHPNDVLLSITGDPGRVACAPPDLIEANVSQHVSIIRPSYEVHHRFLMYWLSHPTVQSLIDELQKGATRPGLTKAQIEALEMPIPGMPHQRRIVSLLDEIEMRTTSLHQSQIAVNTELNSLLPSLLEKVLIKPPSNVSADALLC